VPFVSSFKAGRGILSISYSSTRSTGRVNVLARIGGLESARRFKKDYAERSFDANTSEPQSNGFTTNYKLQMKRKTPINRNVEKIRAWLRKPRKAIRPVSKKRAPKLKEYAIRRHAFLAANPMCAVFPQLLATELHHSKGRVGKYLLDESTWYAVSFDGHKWIHANVAEARERGFIKSRE
jgi:hypothetical protein